MARTTDRKDQEKSAGNKAATLIESDGGTKRPQARFGGIGTFALGQLLLLASVLLVFLWSGLSYPIRGEAHNAMPIAYLAGVLVFTAILLVEVGAKVALLRSRVRLSYPLYELDQMRKELEFKHDPRFTTHRLDEVFAEQLGLVGEITHLRADLLARIDQEIFLPAAGMRWLHLLIIVIAVAFGIAVQTQLTISGWVWMWIWLLVICFLAYRNGVWFERDFLKTWKNLHDKYVKLNPLSLLRDYVRVQQSTVQMRDRAVYMGVKAATTAPWAKAARDFWERADL